MDLIVEKLGYPITKKRYKDYYNYSIKPLTDMVKNKYSFLSDSLYYFVVILHILIIIYAGFLFILQMMYFYYLF